jgi:hypothetical protein
MMSRTQASNRLLALDVRGTRIGYAALCVPSEILGFGISRINPPAKCIEILIRRFRPSVIVLRTLVPKSTRNRHKNALALRAAMAQAQSRAITLATVSELSLKSFFRQLGARNRYEIAGILASWFPDLAWKLPAAWKFYEPEPWTMQVFDAVAVGVVYLSARGSFKIPDSN